MRYNIIGTSNLKVSEIGFGCMSLLKVPAAAAEMTVQTAVANGINYFDTADLYDKGDNEALMGRLLKSVRNNIVLATKVGNEWRQDGSGWDWRPRKAYIIKAVEESLKRLQTDYIDLYQLHGGTIEDPIEEVIEAFEQLIQQGKIRYYGISSIRPNVIRKYVTLSNIQSVMMQYSLLDRRPEEEMADLLHNHQKSILARGVLAQGLLVDKPAKEYTGYSREDVAGLQQRLSATNDQSVLGNIATALSYVLSNKAIASAVIGFRTFAQLEDVLKSDAIKMSPEAGNEIARTLDSKIYTAHR